MKKLSIFIASMLFAAGVYAIPTYELAYRFGGTGALMLPDGKVDPFIKRPIIGGQFAVEFLPTGRWHCLQQWNNASIGVGVTYLNLGNEAKLGSAFAAYGYMNQPLYNGEHFRLGFRPTIGLAAVTKTYKNTYEGSHLYKDNTGANWSIGSILNAYLAFELYVDFPITQGWEITMSGGWHHISNGSVMHPNAGYNMVGGQLGLRYNPNLREVRHGLRRRLPKSDVPHKLYDGVDKKWAVELSASGSFRQTYYADNQNKQQFFGVATLKASAYWVPLSIFRIGGGIDAFYDGYYACVNANIPGAVENHPKAPVTYFGKTYLKNSNKDNCFRVGLSIQPELIIGNLTAGVHVGFYLYDPVKNLEPFNEAQKADAKGQKLNRGIFYSYDITKASNYQDGWCYMHFVLKYHVLGHFFVQLGMKTHGIRAEFIDAGVGVAF